MKALRFTIYDLAKLVRGVVVVGGWIFVCDVDDGEWGDAGVDLFDVFMQEAEGGDHGAVAAWEVVAVWLASDGGEGEVVVGEWVFVGVKHDAIFVVLDLYVDVDGDFIFHG